MSNELVMSITDELIAELESHISEPGMTALCLSRKQIKQLLAERADLKLDALRYRHIVHRLSIHGGPGCVSMPRDYSDSTKEEVDAAIDAAMQS